LKPKLTFAFGPVKAAAYWDELRAIAEEVLDHQG
jgi:plasmid stabilization system protein ParE